MNAGFSGAGVNGMPSSGMSVRASRRGRRRPPSRAGLGISWRTSTDAVRLCVFGLMLVNITAIHMYLGPVRYLRPGLTLLAIAAAVLAMRPTLAAWTNLKTRTAKAIMVLAVLAGCSAVFGLSAGGSGTYILNVYGLNLVFFLLMVISIRNVRDLAMSIWAFVASVGVLVILAQTVLDLSPTMKGLNRLNAGAGMFDANDLGMILVMALPLALLFFFNAKSLSRILSAAILIGIPITIALTGSRGAMVGLVVVGGAILLTLRRVAVVKRVGVLAAVLAGLVIGAPDGYWDQMATLLHPTEDYNYSVEYGRKEIAQRGVSYMLRYPVFGVGVANFPRAEGTISPIAQARMTEGLSVEWIAPHNTYVQVGAEMGVPAMLIWLGLIVSGTLGLWRLRTRLPVSWEWESAERRFLRECCMFLPIAMLGFAVTSAFISHAYTAIPYILFAYMAGLHALVSRELKRDRLRAAADQSARLELTGARAIQSRTRQRP